MTTRAARSHDSGTARRSPVRTAALVYGAAFVLVGVLGFVPGVTTDVGALRFAGPESEALLLGVFQVSWLHNIVHLLYGAAGLALARSASGARMYLLWGGLVYLVLWIYGLVIGAEARVNFVPVNAADDWLHLVLGVSMVALSFLPRGPRDGARTARG